MVPYNLAKYIKLWKKIFILKFIHLVHFMIQIKYYKYNSVQTIMLSKNLNDVTMYILLDLGNKI